MNREDRINLIKSYLKRLGSGEDLNSVREEFVENFDGVDPTEILAAEERLIKEGTPVEEIQKLCDLHSALFHKEGEDPSENIDLLRAKEYKFDKILNEKKMEVTEELLDEKGHPLNVFHKENEVLKEKIEDAKVALEKEEDYYDAFLEMRDLSIHYAKKGDLLYPHLLAEYGVIGPSNVMWTTDDEIRDELRRLLKNKDKAGENLERFKELLTRVEEMIYKEDRILFPNCAVNFTKEDWIGIYKDMKDYDIAFGVEENWAEGENAKEGFELKVGEEVYLTGGHLNINELNAMLNTIPGEITFVDKENINKYFNDGEKLMKRPKMAIDRNVMTCHPPKVQALVNAIIDDFRNGRKDIVPVWMEKAGRTLLVNYFAVRDEKGEYLGTLEFVQDMTEAKKHFLG